MCSALFCAPASVDLLFEQTHSSVFALERNNHFLIIHPSFPAMLSVTGLPSGFCVKSSVSRHFYKTAASQNFFGGGAATPKQSGETLSKLRVPAVDRWCDKTTSEGKKQLLHDSLSQTSSAVSASLLLITNEGARCHWGTLTSRRCLIIFQPQRLSSPVQSSTASRSRTPSFPHDSSERERGRTCCELHRKVNQ